MTKADLDALAAGGCQVPNCPHDHGDEPLFLHCRKHPAGRIEASYHKGVIRIDCMEYHRRDDATLAIIEVKDGPQTNGSVG